VIHISLSPNVESDDVARAAYALLRGGFLRKEGTRVHELTSELSTYFDGADVFLTNSGRSAMVTILRALGVGEGDEVIIQAFNCNAVVNPILWVGATPRYADIDETYNSDPSYVENLITPKTRAIVAQHTFGMPAQLDMLRAIADKHNLVLIEDCAHALGARYEDETVGLVGDVAFLSFGRDKVISSVYGGAIVASGHYTARIVKEYEMVRYPGTLWTLQQLVHPIITSFARAIFPLGALILVGAQRAKVLSKAVSAGERFGKKPEVFPARLPDALAGLALHQFKKLERFNAHRRAIAALYEEELFGVEGVELPKPPRGSIFLRYPIQCANPKGLRSFLRARRFVLGDWYANILDPVGTDMRAMGYEAGMCPRAEEASGRIVNLPTHILIHEEKAKELAGLVKEFCSRP
jgi:dTDP-4-amino-4,6-dideoxygalactose transaminase